MRRSAPFWRSGIVVLAVAGTALAGAGSAAVLPAARLTGGSRPHFRFEDATRGADLWRPPTGTWGSLWADYDGNGSPDLFVGRHGARPRFYLHGDGGYQPSRYDFVSPRRYDSVDGDDWVDRHNCAWGEADGDSRPDLYCAVGANEGTSVGPNQLFLQRHGGFAERARRFHLSDMYGRGRSVNWLDYDSDGDLDLYVGNWARSGHPSALFENRRGSFRRVRAGLEGTWRTISSSWADWDVDGDPDLLVMQYTAPTIAYENRRGRFVSVSLPNVTGGNWHSAAWGDFNGDGYPDVQLVNDNATVILKNTKGSFRTRYSTSLHDGRMSAWIDVENDGDLDSVVVQGAPGVDAAWRKTNRPDFLLVDRKGRFSRARAPSLRGATYGSGDGVIVADDDRDGRQDLFVTNGYFEYDQWHGRSLLLRNKTPARNWIALDLAATRWNPWGIGARIRVRTTSMSYRREVTDGVTFRTQSEVGHVHLGIGKAGFADVRVEWPGGKADCFAVPAGERFNVQKGSYPCP